jgi:hypothetical protein
VVVDVAVAGVVVACVCTATVVVCAGAVTVSVRGGSVTVFVAVVCACALGVFDRAAAAPALVVVGVVLGDRPARVVVRVVVPLVVEGRV